MNTKRTTRYYIEEYINLRMKAGTILTYKDVSKIKGISVPAARRMVTKWNHLDLVSFAGYVGEGRGVVAVSLDMDVANE